MTINYSGEINLGWDAYGYSGDSTHVYGTGILPITGSGGFGEVDYTVDGLWTIVANGSLDVICTEHGSLKDLELNLELNGHVVQWMVACTDKDCIENESDYEKDKTLKIRMGGGATQTQIIPEFFDGGVSITIVTVDMVGDPMAQ